MDSEHKMQVFDGLKKKSSRKAMHLTWLAVLTTDHHTDHRWGPDSPHMHIYWINERDSVDQMISIIFSTVSPLVEKTEAQNISSTWFLMSLNTGTLHCSLLQ